MKVAIVWGSSTGSTEAAADAIEKELSGLVDTCCCITEITPEQIVAFDVVLFGVSTWDIGELQPDFIEPVEKMAELDWSDVLVGFFGCGDGVGYADTFVDAFGIIWEKLEPKGAFLIGPWPVEGYVFDDSRSLCENRTRFLGLALDNDNEDDLTPDRIKGWTALIREELATFADVMGGAEDAS